MAPCTVRMRTSSRKRRGEIALDLGFAGSEPAQKALHRRYVLALIGERQAEKFLDRVFRLGPEALAGAPVAHLRRRGSRHIARSGGTKSARREPAGQPVGGPAQFRIRVGAGAQAVPQELVAAPVAQLEQSVFVDIEERALQHRGEGQIVFRQQQKPAHRDQVLDRQLLGQHQPVGAGDRDAALLQGAQQLADEFVAAPHQHHDVAGPEQAVAQLQPLAGVKPLLQPLAGVEPLPDFCGDGAGEPGIRLGAALAGERQCRRTGRLLGLRHHRRPELDQPGPPKRGGCLAGDKLACRRALPRRTLHGPGRKSRRPLVIPPRSSEGDLQLRLSPVLLGVGRPVAGNAGRLSKKACGSAR